MCVCVCECVCVLRDAMLQQLGCIFFAQTKLGNSQAEENNRKKKQTKTTTMKQTSQAIGPKTNTKRWKREVWLVERGGGKSVLKRRKEL